jgi:hypothetical protein
MVIIVIFIAAARLTALLLERGLLLHFAIFAVAAG